MVLHGLALRGRQLVAMVSDSNAAFLQMPEQATLLLDLCLLLLRLPN